MDMEFFSFGDRLVDEAEVLVSVIVFLEDDQGVQRNTVAGVLAQQVACLFQLQAQAAPQELIVINDKDMLGHDPIVSHPTKKARLTEFEV